MADSSPGLADRAGAVPGAALTESARRRSTGPLRGTAPRTSSWCRRSSSRCSCSAASRSAPRSRSRSSASRRSSTRRSRSPTRASTASTSSSSSRTTSSLATPTSRASQRSTRAGCPPRRARRRPCAPSWCSTRRAPIARRARLRVARAGRPEDDAFRRLLVAAHLPRPRARRAVEELRHLHRVYGGQSYLVSYWQRVRPAAAPYLVVAWHDVPRIVHEIMPRLYRDSTGTAA